MLEISDQAVSLPWKSCGVRTSTVEVVQASFSAVQVLKFSSQHVCNLVAPVETLGRSKKSDLTAMEVMWRTYKPLSYRGHAIPVDACLRVRNIR